MFHDLAATSPSLIFAPFDILRFLEPLSSTLVKDKLYTCNGGDPSFFCPRLFINKLNRAAIFSSQKGRTIYDCHLFECIIYKSNNKYSPTGKLETLK